MIGGAAGKRAQTSKHISEGKAAKKTRAAEPAKTSPPSSADKGKGVIELLSTATDNEFLNAAEVTPESTSASAANELCNKMFGGTPNASDPYFLALVSHLVYSTRQQATLNTHFVDNLRDSLKEMLLMVSHMFSSKVFIAPLIFLIPSFFPCGRP